MIEREKSLEERIASAAMEFKKVAEGFGLFESRTFVLAVQRMKGMSHGPNHTEGDPLEHSQLYVAELKSYLETYKGEFTPEEQRLLLLAGTLHDVGKAESQKYDVVSQRQNEKLNLSSGDIEEAQEEKKRKLASLCKKPDEELKNTLARIRAMSKSQLGKLTDEHECELQKHLAFVAGDFPGLVANFRGHNKKSVEMAEPIITESGIKLSSEDKALLKWLLDKHMDLLDMADLTVVDMSDPKKTQGAFKIFEGLFVEGENGSRKINEKKIKMLLALTYADNASTYFKGKSDGDREQGFVRIAKVVEIFRAKAESLCFACRPPH